MVAGLTAFYMFRLMGLTFWGSFRGPKAVWDRIHESPAVMTIPLVLLAIPSALLGLALGLPFGANTIAAWLKPVFEGGQAVLHGGAEEASFSLFGIDGALILASVTVAVVGIAVAWRLFGAELAGIRLGARPERVRELSARVPFLYRALAQQVVVRRPLPPAVHRDRRAGRGRLWWFDREVVDGTVNAVGGGTIEAGRGLRRIQTGRVQNYALESRSA